MRCLFAALSAMLAVAVFAWVSSASAALWFAIWMFTHTDDSLQFERDMVRGILQCCLVSLLASLILAILRNGVRDLVKTGA